MDTEHPLRRYRRENGLTLDQLAAAAETSPEQISRIETRQRRPALRLLIRLSKATGIPIGDLALASENEAA